MVSGPSRDQLRNLFVPEGVAKFAAPGALLIMLLVFYAQGPLIFGTSWSAYQIPITFYLFLAIAALILTPILVTAQPQYGLLIQLGVYVGVAVGTNLLIVLTGIRIGLISAPSAIATILFQVAVANTEELMFRASLFRLGPLYSTLAFTGFHVLVYGFNPVLLILSFVIGIALYFVYSITRDQFGTSVNAGIHTGFNLALLGIRLLPF